MLSQLTGDWYHIIRKKLSSETEICPEWSNQYIPFLWIEGKSSQGCLIKIESSAGEASALTQKFPDIRLWKINIQPDQLGFCIHLLVRAPFPCALMDTYTMIIWLSSEFSAFWIASSFSIHMSTFCYFGFHQKHIFFLLQNFFYLYFALVCWLYATSQNKQMYGHSQNSSTCALRIHMSK